MANEHDAGAESTHEGASPASGAEDGERRMSRWWLLLALVLVVEFYVYGRRGDVEVCVAKQGQHDFAVLGTERDDTNRWKFPRCETRENLGLRSSYDVVVDDAAKVACRGQTMLRNRGEGQACVDQTDGWSHRVQTRFIPPWDRRYIRHLLWFLY